MNLGDVYMTRESYDKAYEVYDEAVKLMEKYNPREEIL
jgi:cytochrome c-type biogenesis protein CcmH/NrfG